MSYHEEHGYLQLLRDVQTLGERRKNRTGIDTISLVGPQISFSLDAFPMLTTKRVWFKGVAVELDWMLRGESNTAYLNEHGVGIWNDNADEHGELGPVYGVQWRSWQKPFNATSYMDQWYEVCQGDAALAVSSFRTLHARWKEYVTAHDIEKGPSAASLEHDFDELEPLILRHSRSATDRAAILITNMAIDLNEPVDQIAWIVEQLRHNRESRRIILSSWNVGVIEKMRLPPCHYAAQFLVDNDSRLTCVVSVRSWDMFLGAPFNIAQYALLTSLLAHVSGLVPHKLIINAGDAHIYVNHLEQVREQCEREPRRKPTLSLERVSKKDIDLFEWDEVSLQGYDPHPAIKGEMAV